MSKSLLALVENGQTSSVLGITCPAFTAHFPTPATAMNDPGITATAMNVQVGDVTRLEEQIMTSITKHLQSHPFLQQKHLTVFKYPATFACPKAWVTL